MDAKEVASYFEALGNELSKILILTFLSLPLSCGSDQIGQTMDYIAHSNGDTVYLKLTRFQESFYGKLRIEGRGNTVVSGDVRGRIAMDTLIGDFYYRPYQAKFKKRRAYVLIDKKDSLLQGTGAESVYMGIPSFIPSSISFDDPKYIFYPTFAE
ncbi:hypothetical protein FKG96_17975 [Olivibacter sp. LS-1]|uniref:hypothetical protein n=1 Tax=Olivibacter sp. LS-1 TaxID=2592345 RepID=UPI0011EB3864|nr:hypothetical protein [Olivibacter sp. LS-1]QEL02625.1 hypothetical protein FKG96_17975 [Olivibacter sp. LS-1]